MGCANRQRWAKKRRKSKRICLQRQREQRMSFTPFGTLTFLLTQMTKLLNCRLNLILPSNSLLLFLLVHWFSFFFRLILDFILFLLKCYWGSEGYLVLWAEKRKLPMQRAKYEYLRGKVLDVFPEYKKEAEDHLSKAVSKKWKCFWFMGSLFFFFLFLFLFCFIYYYYYYYNRLS